MKEKKLSDKAIMRLVSNFEKMGDDEKKAKLLGEGGYKKAYDIHPDYVLKESTLPNNQRATKDFAKDYIALKQLKKEGVPTETAILINRPGERPLQIQRKLGVDIPEKARDEAFYKLLDTLEEKGITSSDFGGGNFGIDEKGNGKILDTANFQTPSHFKNDRLYNARNTIIDKLTNAKAAKIYRQFAGALPLAGTAYGLMSGEPAMAAEQAVGDVPFVGQAYEAIKPDEAGNSMDDREMITERNALLNYGKSQASQDAKATKQGNVMGRNPASIDDPTQANRNAVGNFLKKLIPANSPLAQSGQSALTPEALAKMQAQEAERLPAQEVVAEPVVQEEFVTQGTPQAQEVAASPASSVSGKYGNAMDMEAAAQENIGKQESAVLNKQSEIISQDQQNAFALQNQHEADLLEIDGERKVAQDNLDSKKIEPHGYFYNKSGWEKIVGGVGLFLGSITPEGAKNVASIINKEIERDTESQKLDYQLKKGKVDAISNRYKANIDKYKDDSLARLAMQREKLLATDYQLKGIQAAAKGPLARAKAEAGKAEIEMKVAEIEQKMLERKSKLQDTQSKGVLSGYTGYNSNPSIVKDVYDRAAAAESAASTITELEGLSALGSTMPFSERKEKAKLLRTKLSADLAKAMFGRSSDTELEIAKELIPDITSMTQTEKIDKSLFKTLRSRLSSDVDSYAKRAGYSKIQPTGARKI